MSSLDMFDRAFVDRVALKERSRVLSVLLLRRRDLSPYVNPLHVRSEGEPYEEGQIKITTKIRVENPQVIGPIKTIMERMGYKGIHVVRTKNGLEVWGYIIRP